MVGSGRVAAGLGAAAAALVLLPLAADAPARSVSADVSIPDRLAGYSYLTADLSAAPTGRALALYQHGFGVEFGDFPQAIVLASDDDVYRRLDAAEDRGGAETQGDPGPMLLSPDGLTVAVGDHSAGDAELGVVDLRTGAVIDYRLPDARSIVPVAWSADGEQVAYLAADEPTNPYSGGQQAGALLVLDLRSGSAVPVPGAGQASGAAFSPDAALLAVQRGGGVAVVDMATGTAHAPDRAGQLAGPAAWSPDGSLLALSAGSGLVFVNPSPARGADPADAPELDLPDSRQLVGWTGPREVAVFVRSDEVARIVAYSLDDGPPTELTRIGNQDSFGVLRMQLASTLLWGITVRHAGQPDRGPLPPPFRLGLAAAAGLAAASLSAIVLRRRRRTATVAALAADTRPGEPAVT